jgi:hypothetical protein
MEDAATVFRTQKPYARILAACWNPVEAREGVLARLILPIFVDSVTAVRGTGDRGIPNLCIRS